MRYLLALRFWTIVCRTFFCRHSMRYAFLRRFSTWRNMAGVCAFLPFRITNEVRNNLYKEPPFFKPLFTWFAYCWYSVEYGYMIGIVWSELKLLCIILCLKTHRLYCIVIYRIPVCVVLTEVWFYLTPTSWCCNLNN